MCLPLPCKPWWTPESAFALPPPDQDEIRFLSRVCALSFSRERDSGTGVDMAESSTPGWPTEPIHSTKPQQFPREILSHPLPLIFIECLRSPGTLCVRISGLRPLAVSFSPAEPQPQPLHVLVHFSSSGLYICKDYNSLFCTVFWSD